MFPICRHRQEQSQKCSLNKQQGTDHKLLEAHGQRRAEKHEQPNQRAAPLLCHDPLQHTRSPSQPHARLARIPHEPIELPLAPSAGRILPARASPLLPPNESGRGGRGRQQPLRPSGSGAQGAPLLPLQVHCPAAERQQLARASLQVVPGAAAAQRPGNEAQSGRGQPVPRRPLAQDAAHRRPVPEARLHSRRRSAHVSRLLRGRLLSGSARQVFPGSPPVHALFHSGISFFTCIYIYIYIYISDKYVNYIIL